ncbi:MAG: cell division protein FtsZ, partial [Gluconacetobacter sp.]
HQGARPSPRSSLFSEQPRAPEPQPTAQRGSLFNIVTGVLRGGRPAPAADAQRAEPALPEQEPAATVRPATGEEVGLDIPAFLRRQP